MILGRLVQSFGCTYTAVDDGKQCLDLYIRDPKAYDVILMDCQMPEMDGYEATRQIRSYELQEQLPTLDGIQAAYYQIPIIAVTANTSKKDFDQCFEAGMNAYISKPFPKEKLFNTIAEYLPKNKNNNNNNNNNNNK